jgi:Spy/CpxP family protein refolding chaperone
MDASRASRKAVVLVLVVFVLGVALGALGAYLVNGRVWGAHPEVFRHRDKRTQMIEQLTRELALTQDQHKELEAILSDMHSKYEALHQQINPQTERVRQEGRERIRAILTPEQRPRFEEFLRRMDEERKRKAER